MSEIDGRGGKGIRGKMEECWDIGRKGQSFCSRVISVIFKAPHFRKPLYNPYIPIFEKAPNTNVVINPHKNLLQIL